MENGHVSIELGYILTAIGRWKYFQKMGREGWEGIIPFYSDYVIFEQLYGNGWRFLTLLIPFYNIYVIFRYNIDLAYAFHKSSGFGVGLALLSPIFSMILGFGDAYYGDGDEVVTGGDPISRGLDDLAGRAETPAGEKKERTYDTVKKLEELDGLHKAGILTDEEFTQKKQELLKRL